MAPISGITSHDTSLRPTLPNPSNPANVSAGLSPAEPLADRSAATTPSSTLTTSPSSATLAHLPVEDIPDDAVREEKKEPYEAKLDAGLLPDLETESGGAVEEKEKELDVYDKFSQRKKRIILAIVSFAAFLGPITSSCFLPSIPQLSSDLQTTPTIIGYTIAIFIFTIGAAPLIWSTLSSFYGRRNVYLWSIPLYVVGSVGVARCRTVGELVGTRVVQAVGSSAVLAVGSGSIGDIYRPTERARAMSWFYGGQTWRSMQYTLIGFGSLAFLLILFFLPETAHGETPHTIACREMSEREGKRRRFVIYWFNPVKSLGGLRWGNVACISINSSTMLLMTYVMLVPLSTIFKERYNIKNNAILGILYLGPGFGNLVGSRVAGVWADKTVNKWVKKRGYRRPEDRLYTAVICGVVVMPVTLIAAGWLIKTGAGGMGPPLVFLFINGVALMCVLTPCNVYLVDASQTRSAESIALNNFIRYTVSAGASAAVLPCIEWIGTGWTNTAAAIIGWLGVILMLLTLKYGDKWRERANEKYGVTYKEADEYRKEADKVERA